MTVTFYDCATAPSPRRARILLAEKGIEVETVQVDLGKGEQLSDSFKAINPDCTVPVLKLKDGTVLSSNAGIAAWAEAYRPEPPLLGGTPAEKGLVAHWNAKVEFDGLMAVAETLRNGSPRMKDRALPGPENYAQIPELAERGRARLTRFMADLDAQLKGREFVAIDQLSVADITALVTVDFAKWVKVVPDESQADLLRWHAAMSARPSAKA
ncbi:glutathione S-transferase [Marinibaculum pumilum]|uniref:Glutathione S-transferase n=1 Tax=Marinibaculum pumilum TaxID=1766165 RepID=A0ABV7L4K2_9PROT